MKVDIRIGKITDISLGLLDVYIEGHEYHKEGRPDIFIETKESLKDKLIKDFERLNMIVALSNKKIVGYVAYEIKGSSRKKIHVDQLIVTKDLRGKHIGNMLMDEIEKIATKKSCNRIELDCWAFNESSINFYKHIGYTTQRILFEKAINKKEE